MSGWIGADATSVTLRTPFPPEGLATALWLVAAGILLAIVATILNISHDRSRRDRLLRAWHALQSHLANHYVVLVFLGVALVCLWAIWIGLARVPLVVGGLIDDLRASTFDAGDPEATRRIVFALAAVLATIAIFGTLIAQAIRVWINERTARTAEESLVTGLINTAVEGLGTEKTISRTGRPVTLRRREAADDPPYPGVRTVIEWQDAELDEGDG